MGRWPLSRQKVKVPPGPATCAAQLKVIYPFPPNRLWINLRQSLCFFELAEVLGIRVNMEEEEGKRKDWLLLWGVSEAATQDRIAGQKPGSTSLSLHIEENGLGPWPERKC